MKAGAAQRSITPAPEGVFLIGPLTDATGVHDELSARALVLDDGDTCIAIVTLDLLGFDLPTNDRLAAAIRRHLALPELRVMLCYSHTHSAPRTINWSVTEWERACKPLRHWLEELPKQLAALVGAAYERRIEATLAAGRGPVQIGMNRRLPTAEGIRMAPNPDGTVVPWTDVLVVRDLHDQLLAVLYTHAAHPVIIHGASTKISADYPGFTAAELQHLLGEAVVPLFACGCAGDINGEPLRGGFAAAEKAGRTLAAAVAQVIQNAPPLPDAPLCWLASNAPLPFRPPPPPPELVAMATGDALAKVDLEKSSKESDKRWYAETARSCLEEILAWPEAREPGALELRLQGFAVGETFALCGLSHEPFAAYQLAAERLSPFAHTMLLGYTNGIESYLPTDEALAVGGYETAPLPIPGAPLRYLHRLNLAPGVESRTLDALTAWLQQLRASTSKQVRS